MIKTNSSYTYNYSVDWGDNSSDDSVTGDITHTYSSSDTYTIKITGVFPHFLMYDADSSYSTDNGKLLSIDQWGTQPWVSMGGSFQYCINLNGVITDNPDLFSVTNMANMFKSASVFNQDIDSWDVSNVTNMGEVFRDASGFNLLGNNSPSPWGETI